MITKSEVHFKTLHVLWPATLFREALLKPSAVKDQFLFFPVLHELILLQNKTMNFYKN